MTSCKISISLNLRWHTGSKRLSIACEAEWCSGRRRITLYSLGTTILLFFFFLTWRGSFFLIAHFFLRTCFLNHLKLIFLLPSPWTLPDWKKKKEKHKKVWDAFQSFIIFSRPLLAEIESWAVRVGTRQSPVGPFRVPLLNLEPMVWITLR